MAAPFAFEGLGVRVWFGDSETPIPSSPPVATSAPQFTVAVAGATSSDRVVVRYRVDGRSGELPLVRSRVARLNDKETATYFKGQITGLRHAAEVQYNIVFERRTRKGISRLPSDVDPQAYPYRFLFAAKGSTSPTVSPPPSQPVYVSPVASNAAGGAAASGAADDGSGATSALSGSLIFDHGLPAANITVRAFNVGFAGQTVQIGETKTDAQGSYSLAYKSNGSLNLQLRVLDPNNQEVSISATKFNAQGSESLDLVVPATVQPLASEFQRLAADMDRFGGISKLAQAEESPVRQDLTLVSQATNWDARITALAATAAKQSASTGLSQDALYGLFRVGLPSDSQQLAMVPSDVVQKALTTASQAGIISLSDQQISAATTAFEGFANKARLDMKAPGAFSSFAQLLARTLPPDGSNLQGAFAKLYFSNPAADDLWTQAAKLSIPTQTLDLLKLQGKLFYLTFNNAPLTQMLQRDIDSLGNLSRLAEKDYDLSDTWQNTMKSLAGGDTDEALAKVIPPIYSQAEASESLAAYAGDLARKVRFSYPTQVAARMIDRKDLPGFERTGSQVAGFLRAAAPLGYQLGRTPLSRFLKDSGASVPALDTESAESLRTLHRLHQITPSSESLQAALKLGFTSAYHIASYSKEEFTRQFAHAFPPGEAAIVHGQAQVVSSVTFNFLVQAKQLDNAPLVYGLSGSDVDRQNAKDSIVQQFPTMEKLFGNVDYCQCSECGSVLSPAAYFVDLLNFLDISPANPIKPAPYTDSSGATKRVTPLDVLIGNKDTGIAGRRPDLGALPLTCENTNTAMPYIDLVNEILEYYVANQKLDGSVAYDTGSVSTADLTAEPQHILPGVYNIDLKQAVYPVQLPFDLWIETVRGFLNFFKNPLPKVLETLRPADDLELFTDTNAYPYYRAQILAETLGLSPSEYGVLTVTDPVTQKPSVQNWFKLYGYADETTALNGQPDPTDATQFTVPPLGSAKNLSQRLGLTYQELTDVMTTGFINPALYALSFQFKRFGINMTDAFRYTNQPGYPGFNPSNASDVQQKAGFESSLDAITAKYKSQNSSSTFDARSWLSSALPTDYSKKVLVLLDQDSGCNFGRTALKYADNVTAATPLDFLKLNLFVRLWKKLGWTLDEIDRALQLFFPSGLPVSTDPGFASAFSAAWKTALVYLAHLHELNAMLSPAVGRVALIPFWSNLPARGRELPLRATIPLVWLAEQRLGF